ncbi:phosphatidylinositol N-acetylglucosaminyltransferase [Rhodotorula paludigena]|uniref:phosphatidylinositol N-acetylglucosaminyltransferase n=1 Tax=Rhodotorula paludigena TaxID=86838 RepID=UPI00317F9751
MSSTAPSPTHLFLPDNILERVQHELARSSGASEQQAFGWGRRRGTVAVVMGVSTAPSAREAGAELETRLGGSSEQDQRLEVLLRWRSAAEPGQSPFLPLNSLGSTPSSSTARRSSAVPDPAVVLYRPLRHLEVLSIKPLRLDFSAHGQPASLTVVSDRRGAIRSPPCGEATLADAVALINGSRLALQPPRRDTFVNKRAVSAVVFVVRSSALAFSTVLHGVLSLLLAVLSFRLPLLGAITDWSCFGRQLHTRFLQAASLVPTFSTLRHDLRQARSAEAQYVTAHATYIRFFNLLWLLANDLIIGVALATFVRDNAAAIKQSLAQLVKVYVLTYLRDLLDWLNSWPMGVKLNDEVATLICRAFLFISRIWEDVVLEPVLRYLPVALIGCAGMLGASSLLALAADLVALLTLPFFACYVVATLVYRWSLTTLGALFNVFRGRKYNPLRSRVEPATYDVDALLLGTILFVTLSFVFPTLAAFYLAFASSRLLILAVETALLIGVAALNAFPLFALLLRLKSPGRLPGGVVLKAVDKSQEWPAPHLVLTNQPLSFGTLLSSLARIFGDLFSPPAVLSLVGKLCTGALITPKNVRSEQR